MLLTEARTPARTGPDGELIPLDEQDRALWDRTAIAEGTALTEEALAQGPACDYQLQAAIAALHDEAARAEDTDWPQILALYDLLGRRTPDPAAALGLGGRRGHGAWPPGGAGRGRRARGGGGTAGAAGTAGQRSYRLDAVRGHLLERAGSPTPPVPPTARPPMPPSANPRPATCADARTGWRDKGRDGGTPFGRQGRGHRRSPGRRRPPRSR
ncbi:hypothetical protein SBADM41S_02430 [Streptomyces badius]